MNNVNPRDHKDWSLLKSFYEFVRPHRRWVMLALLAIPFSTAATILIPYLLVRIIDNYIIPGDIDGLYTQISILSGAVIVGYLADGIYVFTLQRTGHVSIAEMRKALYTHALQLPRSYFDRTPIGVILSRLTSDMEAMGESLAVGALSLVTDFIKTVSLLVLLFYLSWKLTLIILAILPVVYFVVSHLRKKLRRYFNLARESLAEATAYLQECLNGIKTIQLYVAEKKVLKEFDQKNKRFLRAQTKSNFYDATLFSVIEGLTSVTLALIIWYGTGQVLAKVVTIGVLIGFINTLSKIFIPIREFTQQIAMIQRALSALEHIYNLFRVQPEKDAPDSIKLPAESFQTFSSISFENVSFKYKSASNWILKDISFELKKGHKLALVGSTGAGKSSVLKVLTKAYQGYQGSIKINGIELSDIPRKHLIGLMSLMQQDVYLFNESLSFNISLNRSSVSKQDIRQAIEYVYADSFIESLPNQLDYIVVDNGTNLSAGQAQLISFARAIAGSTEVLLLDEATSSVDSLTEDYIQKAIEKIFRDKTVIAVAHRLSTIQHSDEILVMKDGMIVERGSHEALLKQKGYYLQLIESMQAPSEDQSHGD